MVTVAILQGHIDSLYCYSGQPYGCYYFENLKRQFCSVLNCVLVYYEVFEWEVLWKKSQPQLSTMADNSGCKWLCLSLLLIFQKFQRGSSFAFMAHYLSFYFLDFKFSTVQFQSIHQTHIMEGYKNKVWPWIFPWSMIRGPNLLKVWPRWQIDWNCTVFVVEMQHFEKEIAQPYVICHGR